MNIENAKNFVSRLSRTGQIPSGLSIAFGVVFDAIEMQAEELRKARKEIEALKASGQISHSGGARQQLSDFPSRDSTPFASTNPLASVPSFNRRITPCWMKSSLFHACSS